jgi:hypothetical protein
MALTQVDQGLLSTAAQYTGFKNRLINGRMSISQRGTSFSTRSGYTLDRWTVSIPTPTTVATTQSTDAPTGFTNSLLVTVTTGAALASPNYLVQFIEGNNVADCAFGTASAHTVTISFWVKSSVTGTFGGSLRNYTAAPATSFRGYPFTYTISSANTWEQKSITIPGDGVGGAGQWNTGAEGSFSVFFDLGSASLTGTANAWASANLIGVTGTQTSLMTGNGNTFYLTGVQLEKGSTATSFDYRPYGTELALCQRYYYKWLNDTASSKYSLMLQAYSTTAAYGKLFDLPVTMRTTPTATATGTFNGMSSTGGTTTAFSGKTIDANTAQSLSTSAWTGSSGLVAGNVTTIGVVASAYIEVSAEL